MVHQLKRKKPNWLFRVRSCRFVAILGLSAFYPYIWPQNLIFEKVFSKNAWDIGKKSLNPILSIISLSQHSVGQGWDSLGHNHSANVIRMV